jgi:hypothetical protein
MKGTLHEGTLHEGTLHEGTLHEGYFTRRVLYMKGTLHEEQYTFLILFRSFLLRSRNVLDRSLGNAKTYILCSMKLSPKIRPFMR